MGRKIHRKKQTKPTLASAEKENIWLAVKIILAILVFGFLAAFFLHDIYFVNADLGRHIKNGELFITEGTIVSSNYYSYTEPDFPTITHHWGTGVIFYWVVNLFGFKGLTIFYTLLNLAAFGIIFWLAERKSNFQYAFFCLCAVIPLLAFRTEIRPEAFSALFIGVFYLLLFFFDKGKIPSKAIIFILLPLQLLWVNLHIFFIMGPMLVGMFWLNSFIDKAEKTKFNQYSILLIATVAVSFINPFFAKGVLEPFMIMREYGYMVAENQSVFFMQDRFPGNPIYIHFEVVAGFALLISIAALAARQGRNIALFLFLIAFGTLAFTAIRGIPFFALVFVPVVATFLGEIEQKLLQGTARKTVRWTAFGVGVIMLLYTFSERKDYHGYFNVKLDTGLREGINTSAEFYKGLKIQGPIFNNYDIGGYLIYHLYPQEKVFVDNRPEAYSVSFFEDIYYPMMADETKWKEMDAKYNFNCIYFDRNDNTEHGQPFLIRRIEDPEWVPIFADQRDPAIILLKRNQQNAAIIAQYELPKSMFTSRPN